MKEFTMAELLEALADTWDLHETGRASAIEKMNVWLRRTDGIAVYRNNDLGNATVGYRQYVSYGSADAQLEVAEPPEQLPDTDGAINHRYQLEGIYRGAPLPVPHPPIIGESGIVYTTRRFRVALDNHEPARRVHDGVLRTFTRRDGKPVIEIPFPEIVFGQGFTNESLFLVDDGKTVVPHYISGWNDTREEQPIWLSPFPTNPRGETRPDNGKVIDYSDMLWGPRKTYHLKVGGD